MTAPPRVALLTDRPGLPTGFGGQASLLVDAIRRAGAEPVSLALCLGPSQDVVPEPVTPPDGVRTYAVPYQPSPRILAGIFARERPAAIVAMSEIWGISTLSALDAEARRKTLLWLPMDSPWLPDGWEPFFASLGAVVAMAEYGAEVLRPLAAAGARVQMIPLAVRGVFETRASREELATLRDGHGLADSFVALSVGRNQFRKGHPYLLSAWDAFVADLPGDAAEGVRLFLHAEQRPPALASVADPKQQAGLDAQIGYDLPALLSKQFARSAATVEFSDLGAPTEALRTLYGVCDLHVTATLAEGFGVPLVEAQACGRANIAPDHTAVSALLRGPGPAPAAAGTPPGAPFGWLVPCSHRLLQADILVWRNLVDTRAFARALREAWEHHRAGTLNTPESEERRRAWTLDRFGAGPVTAAWAELVAETLAS